MNKNIITFTLIVFFASNTFAISDKVKTKDTTASYTEITILEKGVKRKVRIPKDDNIKSKHNPHEAKQLTSKEGIVLTFKDPSKVSISELEAKYGIKLKTKLVIGYYIFKNISKKSDVEIVESIIAEESNIKTVKPNWKKKNQPR